jgi:hypothetical protein
MTLDVHMFNTLLGPQYGIRRDTYQEIKAWKQQLEKHESMAEHPRFGRVSLETCSNWPVRRGGGCVTSVYPQALKGKEAQ